MDLQLQGRRALVTGSSSGIGAAIAEALAREGAAVAVHGRTKDRTEAVAAGITARGGNAITVLGDLMLDDEAEYVVDDTVQRLGGIDILVNSAGGSGNRHLWEETPIEVWIESYNRNVLSGVRLLNRVIPRMKKAGWGRVINISSVANVMPQPIGPDYSAAKAAVHNHGMSLVKSLGASGVTVNTISPGMIATEKIKEVFYQMARTSGWVQEGAGWNEVEQAFLKTARVPLGRLGKPEEVADVVAFLCSPLAGYVTGANLRIDGGVVPTL